MQSVKAGGRREAICQEVRVRDSGVLFKYKMEKKRLFLPFYMCEIGDIVLHTCIMESFARLS